MAKNSPNQFSLPSICGSSVADLFGPKESSIHSHPSSIFGTVFGPSPQMARGRDSSRQAATDVKHGAAESKGESNRSSYYQQETSGQPFYYSSSIFYGGQDVYSPTTRNSDFQMTFKKDEEYDDPNVASRGNWWQGSLYY